MSRATSGATPGEEYIRYLWTWPNGEEIEMAGKFTPERWEAFVKKPHPFQNGITITRLRDE